MKIRNKTLIEAIYKVDMKKLVKINLQSTSTCRRKSYGSDRTTKW